MIVRLCCALVVMGAMIAVPGPSMLVNSAQMGAGRTTFPRVASTNGRYVVEVVIDAARPDQIDLGHMPRLAKLAGSGTRFSQAWVGQLPSITETSHATIGTGVLPSRHLILGDTWRIPGKDQMAPNLLNGQLDRTGYIGRLIRQTGSPSVAAMVHRAYPGSVVVALSGHKLYAADAMGAGKADYVLFGGLNTAKHYVPTAMPGHAPVPAILRSKDLDLPAYPRTPGQEDQWTALLATKMVTRYHPRVLFINLPEVDVAGHALGTSDQVMQPYFAGVDRSIGRLIDAYTRAGLMGQTDWIVTADHAMVPARRIVTDASVDAVLKRAGAAPLSEGHGDYFPIWLHDLAAVPRAAVALANANLPHVTAVYAKNLGGFYTLVSNPNRLGDPHMAFAYSDLLSTFATAGSPDIVLFYDENTITMTAHLAQIGRKGDHGGATWGAQHIPLFLAGPDFKSGYTSDYPARLLDIAPTVETVLGIKPHYQSGTPLADALVHPPDWAVKQQNSLRDRFMTDVRALENQAVVDNAP